MEFKELLKAAADGDEQALILLLRGCGISLGHGRHLREKRKTAKEKEYWPRGRVRPADRCAGTREPHYKGKLKPSPTWKLTSIRRILTLKP